MKIKIGGYWRIKHVRDGETLAEFEVHNLLTRRAAFHMASAFMQITGPPISQEEGAMLQDFISYFGMGAFFIEQEGDGILGMGGDYDSGRGVHRDDRRRYHNQSTGVDLVPVPKNDNREWDGDLHNAQTDLPLVEGVEHQDTWTHYNGGTPLPISVNDFDPDFRGATSFERQWTYRAGGNRLYRGIWWHYVRKNTVLLGNRGQDCVLAAATFGMIEDPENPPNMIPRIIEMHNCDFLFLTYGISYEQITP